MVQKIRGLVIRLVKLKEIKTSRINTEVLILNIVEAQQRYTFKKDEKLKSRKTIEHLFKEGKSFSNFPFRILWKFNEHAAAPLQTGFAVSSKNFKKAVDRNRIKRLMREAYRLQKNDLHQQLKLQQKQLAVFFIYVGNEIPEYKFVYDKTGKVFIRLIKIISDNYNAGNQ